MTASSKVVEFDKLVKALNKIIFGSEIETVTLNGIVKPTISNFLNSYAVSKADLSYVNAAIAAITGGHKAYGTLAAALANTSTFPQNSIVEITNDPDSSKNGAYQWNGADLTKSNYDPLLLAKSYTNDKVGFVSNIPEANDCIRELYITGWNGVAELYLMYLDGADNGGVSFSINNKNTSSQVICSYKKAQGLAIYPLLTEGTAAGSGYGGYIAIDWSAYTSRIHSQGAYLYKVSKKALSLTNCPCITDYLNNLSVVQTTTQLTQRMDDNTDFYGKTLDASANHPLKGLLNKLLPDVKLVSGHTESFKYFVSELQLVSGGIRVQIKYYNPADPNLANTWASYNVNILKGSSQIDTYTYQYNSYVWKIKVDWNYLAQVSSGTFTATNSGSLTKTLLNEQVIFASSVAASDLAKSNNEITYLISKPHNLIKDANWRFRANKPNSGTAGNGFTDVINADGTVTVHADFIPGIQYAYGFGYGFIATDISKYYGKSLTFVVKGRVKGVNVKTQFAWGSMFSAVPVLPAPSDTWVDFELVKSVDILNWNKTNRYPEINTTAIDPAVVGSLDYEFTHLALIETQKNFEKQDYLNLLDKGSLYVPSAFLTKKFKTGTWAGKKLVTLGHSITTQDRFQPILADLLGMKYDPFSTFGTVTKQPTGIGGSHIQAVCYSDTPYNFDTHGTQDNNLKGATFFTRADWVAQYDPDLIIIFNANNDSQDPLMVGEVTDDIYTGTVEVLQGSGGVPTLISTLKAIFKKLGEQNPKAKIVMCSDLLNGVAYGDSTAAYNKLNGIGSQANFIARNEKLKKVCEMHGVQWIDLLHNCWDIYTIKNSFTAADGTHPTMEGHEKIARYIASQL